MNPTALTRELAEAVGPVTSAQLSKQLSPAAAGIHRAVKQLFDPNLLNQGKKVA